MKVLLICSLLSLSGYVFSQESGTVNSNDEQIHYTTFGTGDPILIINGGPGMSSAGFVGLAKELSKNNRTIIYDQRGTGSSKMKLLDSSSINMEHMIEDIEAIRQHL